MASDRVTSLENEIIAFPSGVNDSGPLRKVRISAFSSDGKRFKAPPIK